MSLEPDAGGASAFERIVGVRHVAAGGSPDAIDGTIPSLVVVPGDVDELQAVVRVAEERSASVCVRGLGRRLGLGNPPRTLDLLISLERMDRVLAHEPADMTVRVQAGCSLHDLANDLTAAGQWLPLDPPHPARTSVGGLLATNASGPLRASQGTARDLLIGLRVMGPEGTIVSGGGRVVKNVAGYDLPKMHVGALGTLGIVLDATFKVRPRPAREGALEVRCAGPKEACQLALDMRDACEPFWLQITGGIDGWTLHAGAGGRAEDVEASLDSYRRLAEQRGAQPATVPDAGGRRHALADAAAIPERVVLRAGTLPTETARTLEAFRAAATDLAGDTTFLADPVFGVVRASLPGDATGRLGDLVRRLRPTLERAGGTLVVEQASGEAKRSLAEDLDVWGDPGPALPLLRRLKEAFDPDARLAPGRYVGGL